MKLSDQGFVDTYTEQIAQFLASTRKRHVQYWSNFLMNSALDKMDRLIEPEPFACQMQNADWRAWGGRYVLKLNP